MTSDIQYYPNANWASISGAFTPEELREIAAEIEKQHKEFQEAQVKG